MVKRLHSEHKTVTISSEPEYVDVTFKIAGSLWLSQVGQPLETLEMANNVTVPRFLNRLLGLPTQPQSLLFEAYSKTLEGIIKAAKRDGYFDQGIMEIQGAQLHSPPQIVLTDPETKESTSQYTVEVNRTVEWEDSLLKLESANHVELDEVEVSAAKSAKRSSSSSSAVPNGYYITRNAYQGNYFVMLVADSVPLSASLGKTKVTIYRPTSGRWQFEIAQLKEKYRSATKDEAKKLWNKILTDTPLSDRIIKHHLLTGSVLNVWNMVERAYAAYDNQHSISSRSTFTVRVARAQVPAYDAAQTPIENSSSSSSSSKVKKREILFIIL